VIEKVNASKKEYSLYENLADYIGYNSYYHSLIMREKKGLGVLYIYTFLKQLSSSPYAVKARLETIKARIMEALQLGKIVIGEKELLEEEDESIDLAESVLEIILQDSEKNALQKELETINRYIKELENINISAKELKIRKIINEIKDNGKCVIFTEYLPTAEHLMQIISGEGLKVGFYYGGLNKTQRKELIKNFKEELEVLISTDAGGQGLNLQCANFVINNDLTWNPMKIEQRIGRAHRIGQKKKVYVYNLLLKDSLEEYVYEVINGKLKEIERAVGISDEIIGNFGAIEELIKEIFVEGYDEKSFEEKVENIFSAINKGQQTILKQFSKEIVKLFTKIEKEDIEKTGEMIKLILEDYIQRHSLNHRWNENKKILELKLDNEKYIATWNLQTARDNEGIVEFLWKGHPLVEKIIEEYTRDGFGIFSAKEIKYKDIKGVQYNFKVVFAKNNTREAEIYSVLVKGTEVLEEECNDLVNFKEYAKSKQKDLSIASLKIALEKLEEWIRDKMQKVKLQDEKLIEVHIDSLIERKEIKIKEIDNNIRDLEQKIQNLERIRAFETSKASELNTKINAKKEKIKQLESEKNLIGKEIRELITKKEQELSKLCNLESKYLDSICIFK